MPSTAIWPTSFPGTFSTSTKKSSNRFATSRNRPVYSVRSSNTQDSLYEFVHSTMRASIRSLNLIGTGITEQGLAALVRELPDLNEIQVNRTYVTPAGIEAVRAHWNGQISFDKPTQSRLSGRGQIKLAEGVYYDIP